MKINFKNILIELIIGGLLIIGLIGLIVYSIDLTNRRMEFVNLIEQHNKYFQNKEKEILDEKLKLNKSISYHSNTKFELNKAKIQLSEHLKKIETEIKILENQKYQFEFLCENNSDSKNFCSIFNKYSNIIDDIIILTDSYTNISSQYINKISKKLHIYKDYKECININYLVEDYNHHKCKNIEKLKELTSIGLKLKEELKIKSNNIQKIYKNIVKFSEVSSKLPYLQFSIEWDLNNINQIENKYKNQYER